MSFFLFLWVPYSDQLVRHPSVYPSMENLSSNFVYPLPNSKIIRKKKICLGHKFVPCNFFHSSFTQVFFMSHKCAMSLNIYQYPKRSNQKLDYHTRIKFITVLQHLYSSFEYTQQFSCLILYYFFSSIQLETCTGSCESNI